MRSLALFFVACVFAIQPALSRETDHQRSSRELREKHDKEAKAQKTAKQMKDARAQRAEGERERNRADVKHAKAMNKFRSQTGHKKVPSGPQASHTCSPTPVAH